jgi:hypothetical protein
MALTTLTTTIWVTTVNSGNSYGATISALFNINNGNSTVAVL